MSGHGIRPVIAATAVLWLLIFLAGFLLQRAIT